MQASALQTEELLDKLSISLTGGELEVIGKLYHQAMKLEIDFFTAQPIVQRTVVPLLGVLSPAEHCLVLFSDFDLTCSVVDSSAILAEIAILTAPKVDQNGPETPHARKFSTDLRNTWNALSRQYTEEYEQCIENIMPCEKANCKQLHFFYLVFVSNKWSRNNFIFSFRPLPLPGGGEGGERIKNQEI